MNTHFLNDGMVSALRTLISVYYVLKIRQYCISGRGTCKSVNISPADTPRQRMMECKSV